MAAIGPPDDALVRALLAAEFARRGVDARDDLLDWLAPRLERSHAAILSAAELLDRAAMETRRRPTVTLARATLLAVGLIGEGDPC